MKRLRLDNATQVRKSLTRVCNMVMNDQLDVKKANSITASANVILSAIKTGELEERVDEIEKMLEANDE